MKMPQTTKRQFGFFDFGLSLLILALAGSSVYVVEHNEHEKLAMQQEKASISASRQPAVTLAEAGESESY